MKLHNDKFVKDWEQLRLRAYMPTPKDVPTIGWGHTKGVKMGDEITKAQAVQMFNKDIASAEDTVNRLVKVLMTQNQFDALVSFVHNLGETNFRSSTLLRRLNAGKYEECAAQFGRWIYQKKTVLRGLVRRRAAEAELFLLPRSMPTQSRHLYASSPLRLDETSAKPATETLKGLGKSTEVVLGSTTAVVASVGVLNEQLSVLPEVVKTIIFVGLLAAGAYVVYNRLKARKDGVR